MHFGFTLLDWLVLAGYLVGITVFGLWMARRVRSSGSYFLGERKLPWWVMVGQAFGTGTSAEMPVAQCGAVYAGGFGTIWYQWKNMLITPFYWLLSPWYRRSERTTVAEMVSDRYGHGAALMYTMFAVFYLVLTQGVLLKGAGKAISVATGGELISPNGVVLAMTVAFILYSFMGGLISSAYTDFVQSLLIIVLSFMLIPLGLHAVHGMSGMRQTLPEHFFRVYSAASNLDAFTIAMLALNGLAGIVAQPIILSCTATGKSERAGRIGQTYGSMIKRFCTIGWALTGLIVAAMVIQRGVTLPDKEAAFGFACRELLCPGLIGLMVACVLAANMSTCSNLMVNTGALFAGSIYREYFNPTANDRRILLVGRLSGLALTVLGILFALIVDQVLDAFLFTETVSAFMGIMILGGILWRRANRYGACVGVMISVAAYYFLNYRQCGGHLQLVYPWLAAPFGWSMLIGFAVLIAVSLMTGPEPEGMIEHFFDNMNRSTDREGLPDGHPRPLAAKLGQDLLFLDLTGWFKRQRWTGFWSRYREDIAGFAAAWGAVAFTVFCAWALMLIGR